MGRRMQSYFKGPSATDVPKTRTNQSWISGSVKSKSVYWGANPCWTKTVGGGL